MLKIYEKYKLLYITDETYLDEGLTVAFTTKHGGVSDGKMATMNMSYSRKDNESNVTENYRRLKEALNISENKHYIMHQVHGNKVRVVKAGETSEGFCHTEEFDAQITECRGVVLTAMHADCVPLLFYDMRNKAIGAVHSGWRSTVDGVAVETVKAMQQEFNTKLTALKIWIGPAICKEHFEVREDVREEFAKKIPWALKYFSPKEDGTYTADLKGIIKENLTNMGISGDNIKDIGLCTYCNEGLFYSHRRDKGNTGTMTGIICMG